MPILAAFIPGLAVLVGFVPIWLMIQYRDRKARSDKLHSPLTQDMLRPPGHSLLNQVREIESEINSWLAVSIANPLLCLALYTGISGADSSFGFVVDVAIVGSIFFVACAVIVRKLSKQLDLLRKFKLGFEGEQFTGQELDQLMLDGCRVFHDVEFEYGNIDHIVVSAAGVFSINTKTLRKKTDAKTASAIVDPSKNEIRFPHRTYEIPIERLRGEAKWLASHLSRATGDKVVVQPMLALPGWFIERPNGDAAVRVFNPRNAQAIFHPQRETLSKESIQRIAHQLEQRCRNVPRSQRIDNSWKTKD